METLHVLVCDDEPGMRMGVARALRGFTIHAPDDEGDVTFTVTEAQTGEEALDAIEGAPPSILLLDHKLPGMNGLDVLDELAPKQLDTLTIMITAYASIETAVRATKQGAYDFLPKPFTPSELRATVEKAANHLLVARRAKRLAEEKRRVRFEFISVLAHELKSPINAIEGYLHILNSGSAGDSPEVQSQIFLRCATRIAGMRKLITDLLDLTRIESGQKPRELAHVNVRDVAHTCIETAIPTAETRNVTIGLDAPEPVAMMADRGEIEIMLNNLISNAVKYNRDNGRVNVSIHQPEGHVVIAVSDTGIGMTPEETAKLFGDFVRIKNEKTQDILGSGLGLSILKKLTHLYHGTIRVESTPDEGSTFTVTLRGADAATDPS